MASSSTSVPSGVSIQTEIPGPETERIKQDLDAVFDARTIQLVIDYEKSNAV